MIEVEIDEEHWTEALPDAAALAASAASATLDFEGALEHAQGSDAAAARDLKLDGALADGQRQDALRGRGGHRL